MAVSSVSDCVPDMWILVLRLVFYSIGVRAEFILSIDFVFALPAILLLHAPFPLHLWPIILAFWTISAYYSAIGCQ
ncbi:hypothetical protein V1506DRAFT_542066 [Lipomyces tetrasporus]